MSDLARVATALLATSAACARPAQEVPAMSIRLEQYPHAADPIGTVRQIYDGVLTQEVAVNTFRSAQ